MALKKTALNPLYTYMYMYVYVFFFIYICMYLWEVPSDCPNERSTNLMILQGKAAALPKSVLGNVKTSWNRLISSQEKATVFRS